MNITTVQDVRKKIQLLFPKLAPFELKREVLEEIVIDWEETRDIRYLKCLKQQAVLAEAIELCKDYAPEGDNLLRKSTGKPLTLASLSARFETAREGAFGKYVGEGDPPSLHECRSLAERLYRQQGINTQTLLGHKHQRMTDLYNDDRGLEAGVWKTLEI